jgi:hypothetical protein
MTPVTGIRLAGPGAICSVTRESGDPKRQFSGLCSFTDEPENDHNDTQAGPALLKPPQQFAAFQLDHSISAP